MPYTPNNPPIYLAAFAGAIAGLGASGQPFGDVSYSAAMSDAFSQAVDIAFGAGPYTALDLEIIREASETAWAERSPLRSPDSITPGAYTGIAQEIVALTRAGDLQVIGEGIDPNAGGGPGTILVKNQGVLLGPVGTVDFVGAGVSTTRVGSVATVTVTALTSGLVEVSVPFSFAGGSINLQTVVPGNIISAAWIEIDTVFDDPAATIWFGPQASPQQILGTADVDPFVPGQYSNPGFTYFTATDTLQLTVNQGASTQGAGRLVYNIKE